MGDHCGKSGPAVPFEVKGEVATLGLIALGVTAAVIVAFAIWAYRRWDTVDSYYERAHQDPPVADLGSYLRGDR